MWIMNNIIYLKNDPILVEFDESIDKNSAKKMIAFKYFNNDIGLLDNYLKNNDRPDNQHDYSNKTLIPKSQLEFSF